MRRRGSGSISTTNDGRKRIRLWIDGQRRSLGVYDTQDEAEAILDGVLAELSEGDIRDDVTLAEWGKVVLDRRELHGLRGVDRERSRWATHVEPHAIASLPVRSITGRDVRAWLDRVLVSRTSGSRRRRGKTISRMTAANALTLLRAVLEDAAARGVAAENVARDVRLPRAPGVTHDTWTYLTPQEQARLLDVVPAHSRPLVAFAIATGLRQGEQWALHIEDVHLGDAPHVIVRYGAIGKPTKSGRPRRVDLLPRAVDAVRAQLDMVEHLTLSAQRKGRRWNERGLLFPSLRGEPRRPGAPTGWERWCERAELGRVVRWHDLRHTCASSLIAGWWGRAWTLLEVRAMLGHSTVQVTERYAHLAGTITEEAVRATVRATVEGIRCPGSCS